MSLDTADSLIRKQNLNDLELMSDDLLDVLFRIQNKFALDNFPALKYQAIQAVLEKTPKSSIIKIVQRIIDEEASLGEKLMLTEVIGNCALALANLKDDLFPYQNYQMHQQQLQQEENEFFQTPSIFDTSI